MHSLKLLPLCLLLAACTPSQPEEPLPEPQAAQTEATGLRDAMQAPLDKAKAVEATQATDEAERREALDATGS